MFDKQLGFPGLPLMAQLVKESACKVGDQGSIPESGRCPGEGNGNPLQYSCLDNPMDRGAWRATVHGVTKSRTRLSDSHTLGFPADTSSTEPARHRRRPRQLGSIPGSGRYPAGAHGNPRKFSCLENTTSGGARRAMVHRVAKSQT